MNEKIVKVVEEKTGRLGPIRLLHVTYPDGRRCWRVGEPGGSSLFGADESRARQVYATTR